MGRGSDLPRSHQLDMFLWLAARKAFLGSLTQLYTTSPLTLPLHHGSPAQPSQSKCCCAPAAFNSTAPRHQTTSATPLDWPICFIVSRTRRARHPQYRVQQSSVLHRPNPEGNLCLGESQLRFQLPQDPNDMETPLTENFHQKSSGLGPGPSYSKLLDCITQRPCPTSP